MPKIAKIVISRSLNKKHQSIRKLSRRLKAKGISVSHKTVQRYLRDNIKATSYKRPLQPKLSVKQNWKIVFLSVKVKWTVQDWRRVLFSDESPFELFHTPIGRMIEYGQNHVTQYYHMRKLSFPPNFLFGEWCHTRRYQNYTQFPRAVMLVLNIMLMKYSTSAWSVPSKENGKQDLF